MRFQARETLVHLQAFADATALGVVVAQDLERIHVIGIAANQSLDEFNLDVKLALFGAEIEAS